MMAPSLSTLLELLPQLSDGSLEDTEKLAESMLLMGEGGPWCSTLNNDGSPLEICIGLAQNKTGPAIRLIADPAADMSNKIPKLIRRERALREISNTYTVGLLPICNTLIGYMLPEDQEALKAIPNAGVWLAADLSGKGMAIYATTKWGQNDERWLRADAWLDEALPQGTDDRQVLSRLSSRATLVSAGIEGYSPTNANAKLYWRLNDPYPLDSLEISLFKNPTISHFLSLVIQDRMIPKASILGNVGFQTDSGLLSSVKLDVCCHCVHREAEDWEQILTQCIKDFELVPGTWTWPDVFSKAEMAFIGLGVNIKGELHLNIYLKCLGNLQL